MSNFLPIEETEWSVADGCRLNVDLQCSVIAHLNPIDLAERIFEETETSFLAQSKQRTVASYTELCAAKPGYTRQCFVICIESETVFNQFFNGRCGYRAMYLRSPTVGKEYNDYVLDLLFQFLHRDAQMYASLRGRTTKIWPFFENRFFPNAINIPKWKDSPMGLIAFDPTCPTFVVKGTFVNDRSEEYDPKPHRNEQLHLMGYT